MDPYRYSSTGLIQTTLRRGALYTERDATFLLRSIFTLMALFQAQWRANAMNDSIINKQTAIEQSL